MQNKTIIIRNQYMSFSVRKLNFNKQIVMNSKREWEREIR